MAKLNLDDDNIEQVSITLAQARKESGADTEAEEAIETAIDNAQAHVFGGDHDVAYVVIEIRK
jgi:hypothetical protein